MRLIDWLILFRVSRLGMVSARKLAKPETRRQMSLIDRAAGLYGNSDE
jgi:hypothetical protein